MFLRCIEDCGIYNTTKSFHHYGHSRNLTLLLANNVKYLILIYSDYRIMSWESQYSLQPCSELTVKTEAAYSSETFVLVTRLHEYYLVIHD
jgi:hypothetical protein